MPSPPHMPPSGSAAPPAPPAATAAAHLPPATTSSLASHVKPTSAKGLPIQVIADAQAVCAKGFPIQFITDAQAVCANPYRCCHSRTKESPAHTSSFY
eukprot:1144456-Pelagomonas_calceolata.AAC.1